MLGLHLVAYGCALAQHCIYAAPFCVGPDVHHVTACLSSYAALWCCLLRPAGPYCAAAHQLDSAWLLGPLSDL